MRENWMIDLKMQRDLCTHQISSPPQELEEETPPAPEAPRTAPGTKSVIHGAVVLVAGYALLQILRFGSNLVLAQMVVPEIFGVMALVNLLIQGVHMLSDV